MVEQVLGCSLLRARIQSEADPTLRRNLELVHEHIQSERTVDVDRTMATLTRDCIVRSYNHKAYPGEQEEIRGFETVRESYVQKRTSGLFSNFNLDRVVADRHCVVTEGLMRANLPGSAVIAAGHPVDDPNAEYLLEARVIVCWPISEDGLLTGEDVFCAAGGLDGIERRKLAPGFPWPPVERP